MDMIKIKNAQILFSAIYKYIDWYLDDMDNGKKHELSEELVSEIIKVGC